MRAAVYAEYGGPEVAQLVEIDAPTAADHELLVKVHAAALNPADWHFTRGSPYPIRLGNGLRRPSTIRRLGFDYAGTVAAVGRAVTRFGIGDHVFGDSPGALAEYLTVPADRAVRKPANLTFEEAAAVPVAAMTALQALRNKARVQRGQKVLINGASGGVGTFAVQLAKSFGAVVTGVQSARNLNLVRSLGADHVIDYTAGDFTASGDRYDVVFDNVGNRSLSEMRRVLEPQGTLVFNGGGSPEQALQLRRIIWMLAMSPFISQRITLFVTNPNRVDLELLADLLQSGTIRPVIDRQYRFGETVEALRHLESGRARGKVVVTMTNAVKEGT
jgi:NADPH:quinone reductase-like Zn-dependent oxidoreductase